MQTPAAWSHRSSPYNELAQQKSWPRRRSLEIFTAALIVFLGWQGIAVWVGMDQDISHFPRALDWAIGPEPRMGYTKYTPQLLNGRQPGRAYIGHTVDYVGKDAKSTGPFVVSVNPIGANTVGVVSLGDNGRCYGELSHSYGANHQ